MYFWLWRGEGAKLKMETGEGRPERGEGKMVEWLKGMMVKCRAISAKGIANILWIINDKIGFRCSKNIDYKTSNNDVGGIKYL